MGLFQWIESGIKHFRWYDISLIKLSTMAFALLAAKYWPVLLSLHWGVYVTIMLVCSVRPIGVMLQLSHRHDSSNGAE